MSDLPAQPTAGELIRSARELRTPKLSIRAAAARIGMSPEQWGNIERGYRYRKEGEPLRSFDAPAATIAKMAHVVGVSPDQLTEAGREDAAKVLEEIARRERPPLALAPDAPASDNSAEVHDAVLRILSDPAERKIWSMTTFTVPERLAAIDGLRKRQAVLEAGLAEDEQGQGSGLASV